MYLINISAKFVLSIRLQPCQSGVFFAITTGKRFENCGLQTRSEHIYVQLTSDSSNVVDS